MGRSRSYDGKKRWNETVRQTAAAIAAADDRRGKLAAKKKASDKRVSGRAVKLSAAMKFVDEDTRALVRNARLDALEADNYGVEAEQDPDAAEDELYVDEDEDEDKAPAGIVDKKAAKARRRAASAASAKTKRFKVKSLAQLVYEEFGAANGESDYTGGSGRGPGDGAGKPTYLSVAAAPSDRPPRRFCVVCGFFAAYSCRRCGSRFCRVKCGDHHKESGCLKFGM